MLTNGKSFLCRAPALDSNQYDTKHVSTFMDVTAEDVAERTSQYLKENMPVYPCQQYPFVSGLVYHKRFWRDYARDKVFLLRIALF